MVIILKNATLDCVRVSFVIQLEQKSIWPYNTIIHTHLLLDLYFSNDKLVGDWLNV